MATCYLTNLKSSKNGSVGSFISRRWPAILADTRDLRVTTAISYFSGWEHLFKKAGSGISDKALYILLHRIYTRDWWLKLSHFPLALKEKPCY